MAQEKPQAWPLKVVEGGYYQVTREADPESQWDGDDVDHGGYCSGVEVCGPEEATLTVPFEPKAGEPIWLLWVTRSTGDTFHHETGIFEAVAAFKTEAKARQALADLECHSALASGRREQPACAHEYSFGILGEDGRPAIVSANWTGYFDGLESASVESFVPELSEKLARKLGKNRDGSDKAGAEAEAEAKRGKRSKP